MRSKILALVLFAVLLLLAACETQDSSGKAVGPKILGFQIGMPEKAALGNKKIEENQFKIYKMYFIYPEASLKVGNGRSGWIGVVTVDPNGNIVDSLAEKIFLKDQRKEWEKRIDDLLDKTNDKNEIQKLHKKYDILMHDEFIKDFEDIKKTQANGLKSLESWLEKYSDIKFDLNQYTLYKLVRQSSSKNELNFGISNGFVSMIYVTDDGIESIFNATGTRQGFLNEFSKHYNLDLKHEENKYVYKNVQEGFEVKCTAEDGKEVKAIAIEAIEKEGKFTFKD